MRLRSIRSSVHRIVAKNDYWMKMEKVRWNVGRGWGCRGELGKGKEETLKRCFTARVLLVIITLRIKRQMQRQRIIQYCFNNQ